MVPGVVPQETRMNTTQEGAGKPGLWKRWIVMPLVGQLKQGISPDKLGWTIGAGVTLGICPVLGTRAWLCLLAGWWFRLNQPVLHSFKSLVYPLHLALIIPFIQLGQRLYGKEPLRISLEILKGSIGEGAANFWGEFGWVILRAASAWLLLAPLLLVLLKLIVTPLLRRMVRRWRDKDKARPSGKIGDSTMP